MTKKRFIFSNILFWVGAIITCFLVENIPLLSSKSSFFFDDFSFFALFISAAVLFTLFYVINHKQNGFKNSKWILIVGGLLLLLSLFATWVSPSVINYHAFEHGEPVTIEISNHTKMVFSLESILFFAMFYLFYVFYGKTYTRTKVLNWLMAGVVVFTYISIIISFFSDADSYRTFFDVNIPVENFDTVKSIYVHENEFGHLLLAACLCCMALNIHKNRWWAYLSIFIFSGFLFLTTCATAMMAGTPLIIGYFIVKLALLFKQSKKKGFIALAIGLGGLTIFLTFFFVGALTGKIPFFKHTFDFAKRFIFSKQQTYDQRTNTWGNSVSLVFQEPSAVVYGYGFGIFRYIVRNTGSIVFSAHNNVLEIFGSYGLIGVALFLSVMVYFLIVLIKILKKRYFRFGFAYLAFATTILLCGIMESFGFFVGNTIGALETFLILFPPLFFYQRLKNDELDKEILSFKTFKERPQEDRYLGAIAYSLVAIFTMVLSALIIYCVNFNADVVMYLSFTLAVVVIFAFTKLYFFSNRLIKKRKFNVPIYMLLIPLDEIALATSLLILLNHFTHNKVLSVIAASTLYLVMSIVVLVIFIKKGNKKFKSIFSEQMEYLFKDHWIKKLVLFILSIALSLVLAFTINPDALQTIAIAIMVGVTFLCIYYMFSKKNDDYIIVTISDEIIAKHQKMIKEEKLHGQK